MKLLGGCAGNFGEGMPAGTPLPSAAGYDEPANHQGASIMAKRQSVNFPGFAHQNPIPNASRIGNMMMSSVISGVDPGSPNLPADLAGQVRNLFIHIGRAIDAAGGTPANLLQLTVC